MHIFLTIVLLLVCNLFDPSEVFADWPTLAGNSARTSAVQENTPTTLPNLELVWYKDIEALVDAKTQIIAANNHLYISTSHGLIALDVTDTDNDLLPDNPEPAWRFNTAMPLSQSPTYHVGNNGKRLYVASLDRYLYALDPDNGNVLWTFEGTKGFSVNPLVVEKDEQTFIYIGNRDGTFYTLTDNGDSANIISQYQTNGAILISAAYDEISDRVFVASMDMHAYAFDATTGVNVWIQGDTDGTGFPGDGFHSYWPVIYRDPATSAAYVIFSSGLNYMFEAGIVYGGAANYIERNDLWPNYDSNPADTYLGTLVIENKPLWAGESEVLDVSVSNPIYETTPITEYFEAKPHRRTTFILDIYSGQEFTLDIDNDGRPEYAPLTWFGTHSGSHYPPVVGNVNNQPVLYQTAAFNKDTSTIARGEIIGWRPHPTEGKYYSLNYGRGRGTAVDEPHAQSIFGDIMYSAKCCTRQGSRMNIITGASNNHYINNIRDGAGGSLPQQIANVNLNTNPDSIPYDFPYFHTNAHSSFSASSEPFYADTLAPPSGYKADQEGKAGFHGDNAPPISYQGMLYEIRSNTLVAFAPGHPSYSARELGNDILIQSPSRKAIHTYKYDRDNYLDELVKQVQNTIKENEVLIDLDPGYLSSGIFDFRGRRCLSYPSNYFSNSYHTYTTLIQAIPHIQTINPDLVTDIKIYLQDLYGESGNAIPDNPPQKYQHSGWRSNTNDSLNADRDIYIKQPPEFANGSYSKVEIDYLGNFRSNSWGWYYPPQNAYAMYLYARDISTDPNSVYTNLTTANNNLWPSMKDQVPEDTELKKNPHVLNAYITGYFGYLKLTELTNNDTNNPDYNTISNKLDSLLTLRVDPTVTYNNQDNPKNDSNATPSWYCHELNAASDYMFLSPELIQELQSRIANKVSLDVDIYSNAIPHWFATRSEDAWGEGVVSTIYETQALFQAKARILGASSEELVPYLDVPAFTRGDLFYIDNLIALLEAPNTSPPPPSQAGDTDSDLDVDIVDYHTLISNFFTSFPAGDFIKDNIINIFDLNTLIANFGT